MFKTYGSLFSSFYKNGNIATIMLQYSESNYKVVVKEV